MRHQEQHVGTSPGTWRNIPQNPVPELKCAISGYHDGQIVYPVVSVTAAGRGRVEVQLYWYDSSDGQHLHPGSFHGPRPLAEHWLMDQGVRLDAQGIYGW